MGLRYALDKLFHGVIYNPFHSTYRSNPYPLHQIFLEKHPLLRSNLVGGWVVSRYEDVLEILASKNFGSDQRKLTRWQETLNQMITAGIDSPYETGIAVLLGEDPPDHLRTRRHAAKIFSAQTMNKLAPYIEEVIAITLQNIPNEGKFEFVSTFSSPFPTAIIAAILGIPTTDLQKFQQWSQDTLKILSAGESQERKLAEQARTEISAYLLALAKEKRKAPQDDALSILALAQIEDSKLTDKELASIAVQLLVAGNETSTRLISNFVLAMLRHPELYQQLTANPGLIPSAIEEFLRYDSPAPFASRVVLEDMIFKGKRFKKGQMVILQLSAANRDPRNFESPDKLILDRQNNKHLAFSHGSHFCLGARLARMEGALALERLLKLIPQWTVLEDEIDWGTSTIMFGPKKLWLEYKQTTEETPNDAR